MKNRVLDTSGWREFRLNEYFDIGTGAICKPKDLIRVTQGGTPRISVKGVNNGIHGYFKDIDSKDYRVNENFISFSFLGTCFYHPYKASLDMKVHSIKPKNYALNIFSGLFLVNVLKNSFRGIYDDQISSSDLKQETIKLPIDSKGNIDWNFMEKSIKQTKSEVEKILQSYKVLKVFKITRGSLKDVSGLRPQHDVERHSETLSKNPDSINLCHSEKLRHSERSEESKNTKSKSQQLLFSCNNNGGGGGGTPLITESSIFKHSGNADSKNTHYHEPDFSNNDTSPREKQDFLCEALMQIAQNLIEKLDTSKWQEFRIGDLFQKINAKFIGNGNKFKVVSKEKTKSYNVPVVYAKADNQGIMYWAKEGDFETYDNVISIIYNGAIAAGKVYAHKEKTGILAESYFIKLKNYQVSFESNLFLQCILEKVLYSKYSRNNLATWTNKVENNIILLPTDSHNNPDFAFMETFIKTIEQEHSHKLLKYYKALQTSTLTTNGGGGIKL